MVLHIAAAALIVKQFNENSTSTYVTYTEYVLSILELVCVLSSFLFLLFSIIYQIIITKKITSENALLPIFTYLFEIIIAIFNIIFSIFVIQLFNSGELVNINFYTFSASVIITNTICSINLTKKTVTNTATGASATTNVPKSANIPHMNENISKSLNIQKNESVATNV